MKHDSSFVNINVNTQGWDWHHLLPFFFSFWVPFCTFLVLVCAFSVFSTSSSEASLDVQGSQPCAYYAHHGFCKFGPTCKFDHPMGTPNYSISASSLTDVPVAPYPHSFPVTPMPPYLPSSDLRPQYTLVKDSSANPPPAPGTTYGPVGSISKVYAPHTLIRSPASAAAGMQA